MATYPNARTQSRAASHPHAAHLLPALLSLCFALLIAAPTVAVATPLEEKQAQAAKLDIEVGKLEGRYDELQERWRGERIELASIREDMRTTRIELAQTRVELATAKQRLQTRAVDIYTDGGKQVDLLELTKAGSFSELFARMDTIERVQEQDTDILTRIRTINQRIAKQEAKLEAASLRQAKAVKAADADKVEMGKLLDQREAKLGSVNSEIRAILEEQRRAAAAKAAAEARAAAEKLKQDRAADAAAPAESEGAGSDSGSSSGGGISIPLPPGSSTASAAVSAAMGKLGSPYVWAAAGPDSFDCSGLVIWAYAQAGRPGLPHSTYSLINLGVEVPMDQLQVGDLLFSESLGHMGMYAGGGQMIHAPHSGDVVKLTALSDYPAQRARRI